MTIVIPYLPVLVAIVGVLVYALAMNPKAAECGRIMFFVGLLVWLLHFSSRL